MPTFPRTLLPRKSTLPKPPTGLKSAGDTGKTQLRTMAAMGLRWTETWPPLRSGNVDVEALIATIEAGYQNLTVFDVTHLLLPGSGKAPNGAGGGTPVVNGGSQTGASLNTSGWSAGVSNVVRAGDVIRIAGLNVLFRVTADANSDGSGLATLSINPPIPAGYSPSNGAGITRSGCTLRARIDDYVVPEAGPGVFLGGVSVTWVEAP